MRSRLPRRELGILIAIATQVGLDKFEVFDFEATTGPRRGERLHAAAGPLPSEPAIQVVFSLGALSPHLFITVTDGDAAEIAKVIGDLELYDVPPTLGYGHTAPLASAYLERHGRSGVVLLRPSVANALAAFPDQLEVEGDHRHCLFVLFLTQEELELKRREGLDALFDHFRNTGRDVASLTSRAGPA